ncbi:MAG: lysozyme [Rickettsiales bacterium]
MRHITEDGIELIQNFEGFSPTVYLDAAGLPTIGYGHLLRAGEAEMFRRGISHEAAVALLIKDVQTAERAVLRLITVPLTDGQFDALVSFTFNLGGGALQRSTLRRKINREDHVDSPA